MPLPMMVMFGVFFFLVGACVGSFLNVVIWRLPYRGREVQYLEKKGRMTLSWPPSHCPMCDSPIHWYQNIPVLSYVALRGRCAKCKVSIPIRYPLVELATALLWVGFYLAYYVAHWQLKTYPWQPNGGVGLNDMTTDWPPYVVHAVFASALLAASAIDADLFIIPLSIPWFLGIFGVAASLLAGPPMFPKFAIMPGLNTAAWWMAKPILGAAAGVILANVLLALKILPRSFPWELMETVPPEAEQKNPAHKDAAKVEAIAPPEAEGKVITDKHPAKEEAMAPPPKLTRFGPSVIAAVVLVAVCGVLWFVASPMVATMGLLGAGVLIFLIGVLPRDAGQTDVTDEVVDEISAGNVRLEISMEILFLAIPVACGALAYLIPGDLPQEPWVVRLLGALLGILVGGGLVWMIRVGGSLAFNKQAMGLGDVHLMAGIGAVIGAPLVIMAFFIAPFFGILWAAVLKIMGKPNVLPYGPWLSVASIFALLVGNPMLSLLLQYP